MVIGNQSIVVIRRAEAADRYGDTQLTTTLTKRSTVHGCAISPRYSSELAGPGRSGTLIGLAVHAPAGTDVRSSDQVEFAGDVYDIDGDVGHWSSPYSRIAGIELTLRRALG